ncbi:FAD assembly factor SdhE [Jannaschia marina]|uniref:FAD assembly factor SdhE n=1 Tax=Jannaschia marina TaxID=2741674 RepID=UPI001F1B7B1A|nr:succinate dehydrogenase assembly factor 2 [Jannaschia marina]
MSAAEGTEVRRKRLKIRAWRRGIKEMDLILGGYADAELATMDEDALSVFEALLGENDHDLYAWVTGAAAPPPRFAPLVAELGERAAGIRG